MIRPRRKGPDGDSFRGVWRLVGPSGDPVTEEIWFCWRRARRAALRYHARKDETDR